MLIASGIAESMQKSSWIRKMFEEGAKLKACKGEENVFDFSIGNPNLPPPEAFYETLAELASDRTPGLHGYMPNAGFSDVREAVALRVSVEQDTEVKGDSIIMSVGAGGALNAVFRAIIDPGDEIIVPRPFFVEYVFYAANHQAVIRQAATTPSFDILLETIEAEFSPKTRAVLINSPNNPTGKVYSEENLLALSRLIERKSAEFGREIFLIADEPYRAVIFDDIAVPAIFPIFKNAIICSSFSKTLSLAGERIGYIAVNPRVDNLPLLTGAIIMTTRILGFVNAPALAQRAVARLLDEKVDVDFYRENRDLLLGGLLDAGYECEKPNGAFYLFPRSPIPDDVAFCKLLLDENILAVPGTGFMGPGHFRLAYCSSRQTVTGSLPGFRRALEKAKGG
jgi:aspartate aminotransferase